MTPRSRLILPAAAAIAAAAISAARAAPNTKAPRAARATCATQSGGVNARTPRCVPLLVWIDGEHSPRRAVIRLGVGACA